MIEHDRLIVGREGIEFPLGTPLVEWPAHGVATFKPFTDCDRVRVQYKHLESTSITVTQDGDWVHFMSQADNATQTPGDEPIAVILELPEELKHISERPRPSSVALEARERFVQAIRKHISHNRAVIIKGSCFSQCRGFSVEDIGMVRPSMSHSVYWQGM